MTRQEGCRLKSCVPANGRFAAPTFCGRKNRLGLNSRMLRKEGVVKQLVNGKPEPISAEEIKTAEVQILKHVQKQSFVKELRLARNEKKERCDPTVEKRMKTRVVKKSSPIYKLDPVIVNG
ncbi:unnamed protein product, partial [Porites lobata]